MQSDEENYFRIFTKNRIQIGPVINKLFEKKNSSLSNFVRNDACAGHFTSTIEKKNFI